jgi:hypothetical protein
VDLRLSVHLLLACLAGLACTPVLLAATGRPIAAGLGAGALAALGWSPVFRGAWQAIGGALRTSRGAEDGTQRTGDGGRASRDERRDTISSSG